MNGATLYTFNGLKEAVEDGTGGKLYLEIRPDEYGDDTNVMMFNSREVSFQPYYFFGNGLFVWAGKIETDSADMGVSWRCWTDLPSRELMDGTPWDSEEA